MFVGPRATAQRAHALRQHCLFGIFKLFWQWKPTRFILHKTVFYYLQLITVYLLICGMYPGALRGRISRGSAPGPMSLGGLQAKRGKKRLCTLNKANKIKCVLSWICEWQSRVVDITFLIQKQPHVSGRSPLMTFIGPLMMHNNFSVTVYGALDWASLRTSIDTGRSRVAGGGPTNFLYKGSEICGPKWFAIDKYIGNGDPG